MRFDPQFGPGEIIVSFGDWRLYYIAKPGEAISYPIVSPAMRIAGRGSQSSRKEDQSGLAADRRHAGGESHVCHRGFRAATAMNPLGVRALYLGSSTYRIHGTDALDHRHGRLGRAVSACTIRMSWISST